jgi:hypothetical protein
MAPELFSQAAAPVSTKTDSYMFGCFILEVLTCREPWWWLTSADLQRVREDVPARNPLDDALASEHLEFQVDGWVGVKDTLLLRVRDLLSSDPVARPEVADVVHQLMAEGSSTYCDGYEAKPQ